MKTGSGVVTNTQVIEWWEDIKALEQLNCIYKIYVLNFSKLYYIQFRSILFICIHAYMHTWDTITGKSKKSSNRDMLIGKPMCSTDNPILIAIHIGVQIKFFTHSRIPMKILQLFAALSSAEMITNNLYGTVQNPRILMLPKMQLRIHT